MAWGLATPSVALLLVKYDYSLLLLAGFRLPLVPVRALLVLHAILGLLLGGNYFFLLHFYVALGVLLVLRGLLSRLGGS